MEYPHRLVEGVFLRRYKRFFCDVEIDGEPITAHIANTGSMRACTAPRATWDSPSSARSPLVAIAVSPALRATA